MNRQYILIAEDDEDIRMLIKLYLESEGYGVLCADNGEEAFRLIKENTVHMAVLDIMMPGLNGFELTQRIREKSMMPILIISARSQDQDKILGLNIGADDYMTKPFNPLEVVARVKALLRRSGAASEIYSIGDFELDLSNHTVKKSGQEIILTPMEYKILAKLMRSPGRIFTKVQLYESISGSYYESDDNTIMVHISRIRDKIEENPKKPVHLKTVRGVGYKFEE